MAQFNFGVGQVALTPYLGAAGQSVQVGTLQDVSVSLTRETKELYGANFAPVDITLGKLKISGKAKSGQIQGALIQLMLGGSTQATGQTLAAYQENQGVAIVGASYTAVNGATYVTDLGVYDQTTGAWLTDVSPATPANVKQYKVSAAGIYTFYTGFTDVCYFNYSYTAAATGLTTSLVNNLMGSATLYQLQLFNTYKGIQFGCKLYAVMFPKFDLASKNDDYTLQDIEFVGCADSSNNVINVFTNQ